MIDRHCLAVVVWSCLGTCGLASAADLADIRACAAITADAQRLACYDRVVAQLPEERAPLPEPRAEAQRAAVASSPEHFGLSQGAQLQSQGLRELDHIEAVVGSISRSSDDRQAVTLDNGQTWVQAEAYVRLKLTTGEAVVIRKAALGSFLLVARSGSMRVKRVR